MGKSLNFSQKLETDDVRSICSDGAEITELGHTSNEEEVQG